MRMVNDQTVLETIIDYELPTEPYYLIEGMSVQTK